VTSAAAAANGIDIGGKYKGTFINASFFGKVKGLRVIELNFQLAHTTIII